MENLELYNKVREVPQDAKKTISAGRIKGFTDINPMWRIKCLTEQFGPCGIGWYYKTVEKWTETVGDETCAFVMIELYVLYDASGLSQSLEPVEADWQPTSGQEFMYLMNVTRWPRQMHYQLPARILVLEQTFIGKKERQV